MFSELALLQNAAGALPDPCLWGSLGTGAALFLASISVTTIPAIVQNPEGPGLVKRVWGRVKSGSRITLYKT